MTNQDPGQVMTIEAWNSLQREEIQQEMQSRMIDLLMYSGVVPPNDYDPLGLPSPIDRAIKYAFIKSTRIKAQQEGK